MRVLVIADDYYHPAQVARAGLNLILEHEWDYIENALEWSPEVMAKYPVTVFVKSNNISAQNRAPWMTPEAEAAFCEYVRQGGGLLAVHSGTAGYQEAPALRALLGGVFDHHPAQCPVTVKPIEGHPLCKGVTPFTIKDEHYFMTLDTSDLDIFAVTTSEHGEQPGGWRRTEGKGRVCVLTPGHNVEVWQHPSFQRLLRNALTWCAGED